ncbi:MAG TPA: hypothetical protein VJV97_04210, partial [Gemmatimonadaceae bacterium]|nr:hypothetical protein [Gemmatimonadaceae bacterium]
MPEVAGARDNRQLSSLGTGAPAPPTERLTFSRRIVGFAQRHRLILLGIAASLSYGMWAFLEKLTASQAPAIVNVVVYGTAFLISLCGLRSFRPPTATALIAGIAGGAINGIVL